MKWIRLLTGLMTLAAFGLGTGQAVAADQDGVAIAIVYDTSGSMQDVVKDDAGQRAPKYQIANRALVAIANRIESFATNTSAGTQRTLRAGLFTFQKDGARVALPMGPFDAAKLKQWATRFSDPGGGTPLGQALNLAGHAVLKSGLTRKHVLVITDGVNTVGPTPAAILRNLQRETAQKQTGLAVHFVAFDVDAKTFDGVKKLGATVVSAANESQLNSQLGYILEKKILLEEEESPKQP